MTLALFGSDETDGRQGVLQHFAIGVVPDRNRRGGSVPAGDGVDGRDPPVDRVHGSCVRELRHADAAGVAVSDLGQAADEDSSDGRIVSIGRLMVVVFAADDVGVHAGAADVLANLVNNQQMDFAEGESRQPLFGEHQQFLLAFEKFFRNNAGGDQPGFVVGVFDNSQPADDLAIANHGIGHGADDFRSSCSP